mmetsp:Transcript_23081/g.44909  ORF Transcript_23081/g.44909 Transcript_23081/m.44909 type:complete len:223 (+) Transcript_23081:793-1461(+)
MHRRSCMFSNTKATHSTDRMQYPSRFPNKRQDQSMPWGGSTCVNDYYSKFYPNATPWRKGGDETDTYKRLLAYRKREMQENAEIRAQRDDLSDILKHHTSTIDLLERQMGRLSTEYSKLRENHERTIADFERVCDVQGRPNAQTSDKGGEEQQASALPAWGERMPSSPVADSRGHGAQHDAEGRQPSSAAPEEHTEERDAAVPGGGDGASGSSNSGGVDPLD